MTHRTTKFHTVDVIINDLIFIPDIDNGKTDFIDLIEVLLERTEQNLYRIGKKDRILYKLY